MHNTLALSYILEPEKDSRFYDTLDNIYICRCLLRATSTTHLLIFYIHHMLIDALHHRGKSHRFCSKNKEGMWARPLWPKGDNQLPVFSLGFSLVLSLLPPLRPPCRPFRHLFLPPRLLFISPFFSRLFTVVAFGLFGLDIAFRPFPLVIRG